MKTRKDGDVLRQIGTLFNLGAIRELTDGQLLERFATGRGEGAELAFAALVERHGAMVLRVCRALLADPHDAEDAFQATFLVLVKKARGLWVRDSLGPWLYGVAFRTASCARSGAARRRRHERRKAEWAAEHERPANRAGTDLEQALHEEIDRLPDRYRLPIVFCDLQGHTCEDAACRMGRPVGTVKSWRSRGRERLRLALLRRGLAPSAGLGALLAADAARGAVPGLKADETVRLAARVLSDRVTSGVVPASVRLLVNGVLKAMLLSKLRTTAATAFALAFLAAGVGAVARVGAEDSKTVAGPVADRPLFIPSKEAREDWPLSLREAIRIGLANDDGFLVVNPTGGAPDGGYAIAPKAAGVDPQRFKAEAMAGVRSIEQQYWSLFQQRAQLRASETAVARAEKVLKRELAELEAGRGNGHDANEAQHRLNEFRLDLVTKSSDVITTERQLRNLLGLPPADDRRIDPVTPPTEALLDPDWKSCQAVMLESQPDLVEGRAKLKEAEAGGDANRIERQKSWLQQVTHQTTHSLARFFLEIDANYKLYRAASKCRSSSERRMEEQRTLYEGGRVKVNDYLDAVKLYASSVAQEAQYKASYNISIVALEEAKGTLLAHDRITLDEAPKGAGPEPAARDGSARRASHEPEPHGTTPAPRPDRPDAGATAAGRAGAGGEPPRPDLAGKTVSFQFTVGLGPRPVEFRGSFTVTPARPAPAPVGP